MANLAGMDDFDPTEQDTSQRSFDNLPAGVYQMEACETDVSTTEEGGRVVKALAKFTHEVLAPEEFKGRKFFQNINYLHTSEQAQRIGQQDLAKLCRAIGYDKDSEGPLMDTDVLKFRPFTVTLGMGKDSKDKNADGTPKYPARTEIKSYHFPDEGEPPEPKAAPQAPANDNRPAANDNRSTARQAAPQAAKSAAAGSKPWKK